MIEIGENLANAIGLLGFCLMMAVFFWAMFR